MAYNSQNKRSRGVGLGMIFTAMLVCLYVRIIFVASSTMSLVIDKV